MLAALRGRIAVCAETTTLAHQAGHWLTSKVFEITFNLAGSRSRRPPAGVLFTKLPPAHSDPYGSKGLWAPGSFMNNTPAAH